MARVALDGRRQPDASKGGAKINQLKAGEYVNIRCQAYDYDGHTGERLGLYDKVGDYFVPDKYMRTRFTGRIPGAPTCDPQGHGRWRRPPASADPPAITTTTREGGCRRAAALSARDVAQPVSARRARPAREGTRGGRDRGRRRPRPPWR